jgi:hypothetical protein
MKTMEQIDDNLSDRWTPSKEPGTSINKMKDRSL